jgi:hypothetical protein
VIVSLLCAIGSALAYGTSTLMQAVATRRSHGLEAVRSPLVVGAFVIDGLGFVLSLLALDNLPHGSSSARTCGGWTSSPSSS